VVEEGATVADVDGTLEGFGMAMGPFAMADLSGNDIGYHVRRERGVVDARGVPTDPGQRYCELGDALVEAGRLGHKTGKGWYAYEHGKMADPAVAALVEAHRRRKGVVQRTVDAAEIRERCLLGLVNEAFKVLEEGMCGSPADIDVIFALGYGWPVHTGGPLYWAESGHPSGLGGVLAAVRRLNDRFPNVRHWKPSRLLLGLVAADARLKDWRKHCPPPRPRI